MMNENIQKAQSIIALRPDVAAREVREALAENPGDGYAHALLSHCLIALKKKEEALAAAKESIRLAPDEGYSFYALCQCYLQNGQLVEAEVAIDEALDIDPFNVNFLCTLASIQIDSWEYRQAKETLDQALEIQPMHSYSHRLNAYVLNKLDRCGESDMAARTSLSLMPESADNHAFRGWTLIERQCFADALPHFREALRLCPDSEWARQGFILTAPSQHWIFRLHMKVANPYGSYIVYAWVIVNLMLTASAANHGEQVLLALMCPSWLALVVYALLLIPPDSVIAGPVVKFILQFEPDGRYVLTRQERRYNQHLLSFSILLVGSFVVALINHCCLPFGIVLILFLLTRPMVLQSEGSGAKCLIIHAIFAALSGGLLLLIYQYGDAFSQPLLPASCAVALGTGAGVKALGGATAVGVVAGAQSLKQKKKEKARERMLHELD